MSEAEFEGDVDARLEALDERETEFVQACRFRSALRVSDEIRVFGFVTCERFDDHRLAGHVAVYLPQSYNFAGNLMIVPRDRVEHVDADSAQFMAFIVSGGVAHMSAARTAIDSQVPPLRTRR